MVLARIHGGGAFAWHATRNGGATMGIGGRSLAKWLVHAFLFRRRERLCLGLYGLRGTEPFGLFSAYALNKVTHMQEIRFSVALCNYIYTYIYIYIYRPAWVAWWGVALRVEGSRAFCSGFLFPRTWRRGRCVDG